MNKTILPSNIIVCNTLIEFFEERGKCYNKPMTEMDIDILALDMKISAAIELIINTAGKNSPIDILKQYCNLDPEFNSRTDLISKLTYYNPYI